MKKNYSIDRAINEFRSGRPIIVNFKNRKWIFFTIEHVNIKILSNFFQDSSKKIFAFMTNKKIKEVLSIKSNYKDCYKISINKKEIKWLQSIHLKQISKYDRKKFNNKSLDKSERFINDIMDLSKNAKMIPCLIGSYCVSDVSKHLIMTFDHEDFKDQDRLISKSTKMLSTSQLPLIKDHKAKIIVYKSFIGGLEHTVIKIGSPNVKKIVNIRIQSACLTGEVFHSMKCDCNEQLHQSIDFISDNGGGYIIHLEQEGRDIGLTNKIRAYDLQSKGIDTIDANTTLGFLGDERDFGIAVTILKHLKIKRVNLITNNQDKLKALIKGNIKINIVIPTYPTENKFNENYLSSKFKRKNYKIKPI